MADIKWGELYPPFVAFWNRMKDKYGEEFEYINGLHNNQLSNSEFISKFKKDQRMNTDPSANRSRKDVRNLLGEMTKPQQKLMGFNKIFSEISKKYGLATANAWGEQEWSGGLYEHDASTTTFFPYCYAYDIQDMCERGLYFLQGENAKPAQHLHTFANQLNDFVAYTSNRSSGACGLPSFFVYSFYFWNKDKQQGYLGITDWEAYRRQHFQEVIYALNHPNTRVIQSAFTNFSIMDHEYLTQLFGARKFPDGTYVIDYIDDIVQHQKVFLEVVSKIRETQMFTFPVLTYSLLYQDGKFVDEDFAKWCCKHNVEWGDSNFFVGSDVTTLSNCCRLLSDTSKLDPFINSIGGTSLSVGSIKVNTINLRRISLESGGDKERFMQILDERVQLCMKALDIIRDILKSNISKGLLPTYEYEMIDMQKQYSTIGITAMYEVVNDFGGIATDAYGNKSYTDDGIEFASRIMKRINEIKNRDADKFGCKFNIEAIPAESANIKLCEKDHLLFKDKVQEYIYSNQWIGMGYTATLAERIRLGSILDKECNGGQIAHISIDGKFTSFEQAWTMLNEIASRGCIYFAFNYKINTCANNHSFVGGATCPNCGRPVENTWTRIVGFYTPVKAWSPKRREEFDERKWYTLTDDGIF